MRPLVDSIRDRLRLRRSAVPAVPSEWEPVFEQSSRRQISAPARSLCAITDIGKARSKNEDAYSFSSDLSLWIVADGMGGHAAGEIASALTVQKIVESMDSASAGMDVPTRLMTAFASAHLVVSTHGLENAGHRGMGSTAVAAVTEGRLLHICHVGDSRAYHLSEGRLRRLTNDHSWVWGLVEAGMLTPAQARSHALRGKLLQAIGCTHGIKPEMTSVNLKADDRVLLCSDGLWEALSDDELRESVAPVGSLRGLAGDLVDRANAAGGRDNITAILYQHSNERESGAG